MRKYLRGIAKARMEKAGIQHMNKKRTRINPKTGMPERLPSYFALNWRDYIREAPNAKH